MAVPVVRRLIMAKAIVTFSSSTNRAHFMIDWSELGPRTRTVVLNADGAAEVSFFDDERQDMEELAREYGGEIRVEGEEYDLGDEEEDRDD